MCTCYTTVNREDSNYCATVYKYPNADMETRKPKRDLDTEATRPRRWSYKYSQFKKC